MLTCKYSKRTYRSNTGLHWHKAETKQFEGFFKRNRATDTRMSNSKGTCRRRGNRPFPTEISAFRFVFPLTLQMVLELIGTDNNKNPCRMQKLHSLLKRDRSMGKGRNISVSSSLWNQYWRRHVPHLYQTFFSRHSLLTVLLGDSFLPNLAFK